MSRRSTKRSAIPQRTYPKLKLSPAKDAFTQNTGQITGNTTNLRQNQSSPTPPLPPQNAFIPAGVSEPQLKKQRLPDDRSPALKLTFVTTPTATVRSQRYVATRIIPGQISASTAIESSLPVVPSVPTTPTANSSSNGNGNGNGRAKIVWDPPKSLEEDPDLLMDEDFPEVEELLRNAPPTRPKLHYKHNNNHSRMTLQLTSVHAYPASTQQSQLVASAQIDPPLCLPVPDPIVPAPELEEQKQLDEVVAVVPMDTCDATLLMVEPSDVPPHPPVSTISILDLRSLSPHIVPPSKETTPASSPRESPAPSNGGPPEAGVSIIAPASTDPTIHFSLKSSRPISSQIQLSAVAEGENEDQSQSQVKVNGQIHEGESKLVILPLAHSPNGVNVEEHKENGAPSNVASDGHLLRVPSALGNGGPNTPSRVAATDHGHAGPSASQSAAPSASQQLGSQSQQSATPTGQPFWPDEFPSLSYLYSDFPDPVEDEEAKFQSLARDVPRHEQEVDVSGEGMDGSGGGAGANWSSQQATQLLPAQARLSQTTQQPYPNSLPFCESNANTQILPTQRLQPTTSNAMDTSSS